MAEPWYVPKALSKTAPGRKTIKPIKMRISTKTTIDIWNARFFFRERVLLIRKRERHTGRKPDSVSVLSVIVPNSTSMTGECFTFSSTIATIQRKPSALNMFCILPHAYTLPNHEKMAKQRYKMNMIDGRRDNEFTDLKIYDLLIFLLKPQIEQIGTDSFLRNLINLWLKKYYLILVGFEVINIDDSQLEGFGDKTSGIHTRSFITSEQTVHEVVLSLLQ